MDNRKQLFRNANTCKSSPLNPATAPSLALYSTHTFNFHCLLPPKHEESIWCELESHFNACWLSKSGFAFSPGLAGLLIWRDLMNQQERDGRPRLSWPEGCSTCASGGSACLLSGLWQTWSPIPSKWVNPVRLVHTPVVCFEKHLSMDICPEDRSGAPSLSPISRTGWLHLGLTVARCAPDQTAALRRHFCRCFCHSWCNFLEFQHLADVGISSGEL